MADAKLSCAFCLEDLKRMVNPRKLPCRHVFCLDCLLDDYSSRRSVGGYQCPVCKQQFSRMDIEALPVVTKLEAVGGADSATSLKCDRCKDDQSAAAYCVDCGEKSCSRHMEFHEGYFEGSHAVIDIKGYRENLSTLKRTMGHTHICSLHDKHVITMSFARCYQFNCTACHQGNMTCRSSTPTLGMRDHSYQPLETVEQKIKPNFRKHLQTTAGQLDCLRQEEKKTYQKMDKVAEQCKDMVHQVERSKVQQIHLLTKQAEDMTAEINNYQTKLTNQLIEFVRQNHKAKERLDKARKDTLKSSERDVLGLINGYVTAYQKIDSANRVPITELSVQMQKLHIGAWKKVEMYMYLYSPELQPPEVRSFVYRGPYP